MIQSCPVVMTLDDDDAVRESLACYFDDRGWRVLQAGSAEDALRILSEETIDGFLVDIRLPGMDGNEFIRRACRLNPHHAFVILTGSPEYRSPGDIAHLSQVADHIFSKPVVELGDLEAALRRQIQRCRERE